MHNGHGKLLTFFLQRVTAAVKVHISDLLTKVVVEEAVDDGVDTGGGHRQQVAEGEEQVVVADRQSFLVPVRDHIEDCKWQPAECECCNKGNQHDVDSAAVVHALAL